MKHRPLAEDPEEESICRICLEPGEPGNPLLTPCLCTGSVKHIHEQCLKIWLVAKAPDLDMVRCELCKANFVMSFKFARRFAPLELCREHISHWIFMPLLCAVFTMLIVIGLFIIKKLRHFKGELFYVLVLLGTCGLSCLMILYLCYYSIVEACFTQALSEWTIQSRSDQNEGKLNERPASTLLEQSSNSLLEEIMRVPATVKIAGKVIRTPLIECVNLLPVCNEGSVVGYTSRLKSGRSSIDHSRNISYSACIEEKSELD